MAGMATGFWVDERCFWHSGGNYAFLAPVGGLVQPLAAGGLPENPETKRRLRNLVDATGLAAELVIASAEPATEGDLRRVHPADYLARFRALSDAGGGEVGERTPFGPGGYEIAALSAGLAKAAVMAVATGAQANAYALSRPPGHHCTRDTPMGFCLLANIAIAVEAARAAGVVERVAVIDWDVHHGNGTEAIFWERGDVLALSIHQERNYPRTTGGVDARGEGAGAGATINLPLVPGGGHDVYLHAFRRVVLPALMRFRPDLIVVACGFDASGVDPLGRMLAGSDTFAAMTGMAMEAAADLCGGRLVLVHEGGYSELHVPFCGHAVIAQLAGSAIEAPDPLGLRITAQQPGPEAAAFHRGRVDAVAEALGF
jgi:acetoin utilization deacetylase AcuC-like enzyme